MRPEIEQAVSLIRNGDPKSVDAALALLQDTVFSFSMKMCGQREDAEDTMQEVLVQSLPQLPRLTNPKALVVWLYKVAKTRCLMNRRKSRFAPKTTLSLEELMPDRKELERLHAGGSVNPEAFAMRSQEAQQLRDAVQKLPPEYRIVLVLRDMEGLRDEEVGEITGLRPGTVRVRLHRARLFVRKEMARHGKPASVRGPRIHAKPEALRPARCKAMFAELSNYLDEQLDDSMCEELARHMEGCEPCEAFLSSLENTIRQCRQLPKDSPGRRKSAALRRELMELYQQALAGQK